MMVRWYNKVRQTMLHVEFPLIRNELMDIDKEMERGEQILRWKDDSTLEKEKHKL
jgi:dynein heavy chain